MFGYRKTEGKIVQNNINVFNSTYLMIFVCTTGFAGRLNSLKRVSAHTYNAQMWTKEKIQYKIMNMVVHGDEKSPDKKLIHHFILYSNIF